MKQLSKKKIEELFKNDTKTMKVVFIPLNHNRYLCRCDKCVEFHRVVNKR